MFNNDNLTSTISHDDLEKVIDTDPRLMLNSMLNVSEAASVLENSKNGCL